MTNKQRLKMIAYIEKTLTGLEIPHEIYTDDEELVSLYNDLKEIEGM